MKAEEFRRMDPVALDEELVKRQRELLELRCQVSLGEEVHPHRIKELRKDIARIKTVKRGHELQSMRKEAQA